MQLASYPGLVRRLDMQYAPRILHFSAFHWVCLSVCLSVCVCLLSHISPTECLFILKTLSRTQRATKVKKKICGVFSENAPLLRSSGVAVMFHTFRWPFFLHSKVVRMRIGIHSYACRTAGEYPACPTIVNSIQPCPKHSLVPRLSLSAHNFNV